MVSTLVRSIVTLDRFLRANALYILMGIFIGFSAPLVAKSNKFWLLPLGIGLFCVWVGPTGDALREKARTAYGHLQTP